MFSFKYVLSRDDSDVALSDTAGNTAVFGYEVAVTIVQKLTRNIATHRFVLHENSDAKRVVVGCFAIINLVDRHQVSAKGGDFG